MIVLVDGMGDTWGHGGCRRANLVSMLAAYERTTLGYRSREMRDGRVSTEELVMEVQGALEVLRAGSLSSGQVPVGMMSWLHIVHETEPMLLRLRGVGGAVVNPWLPELIQLRIESAVLTLRDEGLLMPLRDYQAEGIVEGLCAPWGRCVIQAATGSGKTVMAAGLLMCMQELLGLEKVGYLVVNQELARQTQKVFDRVIPEMRDVVGGDVGQGVPQCMSVGTAGEAVGALDGVVIDECFPAGTLVDGKPIEDIEIGDQVSAYNETSGNLERRTVTGTFVRKAPSSLIQITTQDGSFICTEEHPVFTQRGWIPAKTIARNDRVLYTVPYHKPEGYRKHGESNSKRSSEEIDRRHLRQMRTGDREEKTSQRSIPVLPNMQIDEEGRTKEESQDELHKLREGDYLSGESGPVCPLPTFPRKGGLLLGSMCQGIPSEGVGQNPGGASRGVVKEVIRANAEEQPDEGSQGSRPGDRQGEGEGLAGRGREGGQRTRTYSPPTNAGRFTRLGNGAHCPDETRPSRRGGPEIQGISHPLQDRHCPTGSDGSHRGRRPESQQFREARSGPEERQVPRWTRVDRIQVFQQGSFEEYERVCPDGLVYNLEVEGLHTYTANGFVVHNCHAAMSNTRLPVLGRLRARCRIGLTATPDGRQDGRNCLMLCALGPIVRVAEIADLERGGYLARGEVVRT
jgi:hypothetical protein